ncbi:MAG: hypothetical protein IKZ48_01145 [Prevotella sp.]|nr:hypothetical protein [Prevotella sp.]
MVRTKANSPCQDPQQPLYDDMPSIELLAVTLKRCGFRNGKIAGQRVWYATPNEIIRKVVGVG